MSACWCLTCRVERGVKGVRWSLVKGGGGAIRLCRHTHALVVAFEKTFKITFFSWPIIHVLPQEITVVQAKKKSKGK